MALILLEKIYLKTRSSIFHKTDWNFLEPTFLLFIYEWEFNKIGARQTNQ